MPDSQCHNSQGQTSQIADSVQHLEPMIVKIDEIGYTEFQHIIALGRWPDGQLLSSHEQSLVIQAMLIYEHRHVPLEARTGFIHKGYCC